MKIKHGTLFTKEGFIKADLEIQQGKIVRVAKEIAGPADIDAEGLIVSPGFIDLHVHLREPGFCYKETIESGTHAAAKGGFTTVCAMPNLVPAPDTKQELENTAHRIQQSALVKVRPYGCITIGEKGETVTEIAQMAPLCIGFSDDGKGVQSEECMRRAMAAVAKAGSFVAAHCEVESLLEGGYVHKGPWAKAHGYKGVCSESETAEVVRDIEFARQTGARLHICHISAKESLAAVAAAQQDGLFVTCETTPHQALLCDEDITEDSGRFKMNPPLRERADMRAIRAALASGVINAIATDHAPHSAEEKAKGLAGSNMGVVGLETAFGVLCAGLVKAGELPLERLLYLLTFGPAAVAGLPCSLTEGSAADIVLLDPKVQWTVSSSEFVSKGKSTPFEGYTATGKVVCTIVDGRIVYKEEQF